MATSHAWTVSSITTSREQMWDSIRVELEIYGLK